MLCLVCDTIEDIGEDLVVVLYAPLPHADVSPVKLVPPLPHAAPLAVVGVVTPLLHAAPLAVVGVVPPLLYADVYSVK